ncbi:MAG: fatty acid desaturase [bacterium]
MQSNGSGALETNAAGRRAMALITHAVVWTPAAGALAAVWLAFETGVTTFDWVLLLVMYLLTVIGVELGLHRYVSHRAFRTTGFIEGALVVLGSMAAQGPALYWASTHRRHHAFSDQEGDPHSPCLSGSGFRGRVAGLFHAHMGWLFQPVQSDWLRYIPDLVKDSRLFRLNQLYFVWMLLGLAIPAAAGLLHYGTVIGAFKGLLWGGLGRIFLVHHAVWGVNSLCHRFGSRPFPTREQSRNLAIIALPSLGGGWHNNHHAFPRAADNRLHWWQLDVCGLIVRFLDRAHLAWDVHYPDAASFKGQRRPDAGMSPSVEG